MSSSIAVNAGPTGVLPMVNDGMPGGAGNAGPLAPELFTSRASTSTNWDSPRVAIMPITRGRCRSRRTTLSSIAPETAAAASIATGRASQYGSTPSPTSRPSTAAPKTPTAPCAKLTNRLDR